MSLEAQSGWPQPEFDGLIDEFDLESETEVDLVQRLPLRNGE